jgi:hypothetical protein
MLPTWLALAALLRAGLSLAIIRLRPRLSLAIILLRMLLTWLALAALLAALTLATLVLVRHNTLANEFVPGHLRLWSRSRMSDQPIDARQCSLTSSPSSRTRLLGDFRGYQCRG